MPPPLDSLNSTTTPSHVFNVGGVNNNIASRASEEEPTPTLLGEIRDNPYTVSKMTEAYNNINTINIGQVSTTNLYVKFCPNNVEELMDLINEDLELLDFPMEYEVLEMGDYYDDPNIAEGELPCYYTVVEPNYVFPTVPYDILERLHIADYNSLLAKEAFKLTGQEYSGDKSLCTEEDPDWPTCQCDIFLNVNQAEWQACVDAVTSPPVHSTCTASSDWRRLGGRIKVADTQLGLEGVKKAKVVWWNGWFSIKTTHTDDNGCWSINTQESGKAYMWVRFKNEKATVRTIRLFKLYQYLYAVTDYVGLISAPPYNDVTVNYLNHPNVNSRAKRYWLSATTLNAVDDFYDYANQDDFLTPPEGLNVLLHTFGKSTGQGGAPMFQQALSQSMLYDYMKKKTLFNFPWGTLTAALMEVLEQTAPDITYHYINTASDQVKETIYHELAHASHYRLVGNTYWNKLRWHVIANDGGYGDPTDPGPGSAFGRVAVSEAWGYHIGPTFADRQYGLNHSNTADPTLIESNRHLNLLESKQWASGFIPRGLMLDLIDDNLNDYLSGSTYENGMVTDNTVSGFTNAVIFNKIGASVTNPAEFESALSSALPSGVTMANLAALFAQY